MISGSVVLYKIASTCLLILAGYIVKRLRALPDNAANVLSRFLVYLAFPCYLLYYMPNSVTAESLAQDWRFPVIGFFLLLVADLFGYAAARAWARPDERATFRILVALPNWVFMALAVCEPLFREDGARVVLLYNIGITFYLWTFGLTSFRTATGSAGMARQLFLNPQTIAMLIGLVLAVAVPSLRGLEKMTSDELAALPFGIGIITPIWETVYLLAETALPVSIFQIGLHLDNSAAAGVRPPSTLRSLTLACVLRLLAVPVLSMAILFTLHRFGVRFTFNEFMVSILVMAMAPAVVILSIVDIYNGASRLAAWGILWGSIASLVTAPAITWLAQRVYPLL
ncbi:MAG: AEC family transporter [Planctomycetota bacterium]|jgi:predicted permease|nr:AEC family transporter [Planctomycetota bacterium]